jgi:hypothetical protein
MDSGGGRPALGLAYADPGYALSLGEFGSPLELPRSGGWLLRRAIPGTPWFDAMGPYPLFACRDWSQLADDLGPLADDLVSVTLVTDPFSVPGVDVLETTFDLVRPYKPHFLIDLDLPPESFVARHHRKAARKALRSLVIEEYDPASDLETWCDLYASLVARHQVSGVSAFSDAAFEVQAGLDGMVGLRATLDGRVVGLHWYLATDEVVYAHLVALDPDAYRLHADAGMIWTAIERFAGRHRWIDMGAGALEGPDADDGLSEFKRGWAAATRPTYLCGKVLDAERYSELSGSGAIPAAGYFPAYRRGEFGGAEVDEG